MQTQKLQIPQASIITNTMSANIILEKLKKIHEEIQDGKVDNVDELLKNLQDVENCIKNITLLSNLLIDSKPDTKK